MLYNEKMKKVIFTQEGYAALLKEKESLDINRKITLADLQKAREMGDLSENGFYKASKMRLGDIDHRLFETEMLIKHAFIVEKPSAGVVGVGTKVQLESAQGKVTYDIVGDREANVMENKISTHSPLGKALVGKRPGEVAEVHLPNKIVAYTILSVT